MTGCARVLHNVAMGRKAGNPGAAGVGAPGRRARKAAATRRALFDAGLEAVGRRPFGVVSVLDLTDAVDVAKGVFYLHFKSKDEFLIELLRDVLGQFLEGLEAK